MYSITVDKQELLETLQRNLEKHVAEYEEAISRYPGTVAASLRKRADAIDRGEEVNLAFNLPKPRSYADEYEDAIQMLQWEQKDSVDLDQTQFKNLVQDEWHWKDGFSATTQFYNGR